MPVDRLVVIDRQRCDLIVDADFLVYGAKQRLGLLAVRQFLAQPYLPEILAGLDVGTFNLVPP